MTPPDPLKVFGNSKPMVVLLERLYWMVEAAPKVGEAEMVAVPSMERMPLIIGTFNIVFAPDVLSVRLLKVVNNVPFNRCVPPPLKATVPVLGTNTPAVLVQAFWVVLTLLTFMVLEPPFKVPAESVMAPENACVNPVPRLRVPPEPLIVSAPPLLFPKRVTDPAVLEQVIVPEVVKGLEVLAAELLPVNVIGLLTNVSVPVLIKLPRNVRAVPLLEMLMIPVFVKSAFTLCTIVPLVPVMVPPLITKPATFNVLVTRLRLPPELIVSVLQLDVPLKDTAAVPETIVTSSRFVGTTPSTHVPAVPQEPPAGLLVRIAALTGIIPTMTIIKAISKKIFGWDIANPLIQKRFKVFKIEKLIVLTVRSSLVVTF